MIKVLRYTIIIFIILFTSLTFAELRQEYYPGGKLMSEINYEEGIENGPAKWYYPSGKIKQEGIYENGRLEGDIIAYYENGQVWEEGFITYTPNSYNQKIIFFYKNGNKRQEYTVKEALPDGIYKEYYENGNIKIEISYKKGIFDGFVREYNINGKLIREKIYKNNKFISKHEF